MVLSVFKEISYGYTASKEKKKRDRAQINKIREKREVTTDTPEIQKIIRNYCEQLYDKK